MGLNYDVKKMVFNFDETKTEKFVAIPVISGEVSFAKLCSQVSQICGAHRGIVQLVTAGVIDAMVNNLEDGKSVRFGDFGIFRPAINAKSVDNPEEVNSGTIYRRRIRFIPGSAFKDAMKDMSVTRFAGPNTSWKKDTTEPGTDPGNSGGGDEFIDPSA